MKALLTALFLVIGIESANAGCAQNLKFINNTEHSIWVNLHQVKTLDGHWVKLGKKCDVSGLRVNAGREKSTSCKLALGCYIKRAYRFKLKWCHSANDCSTKTIQPYNWNRRRDFTIDIERYL